MLDNDRRPPDKVLQALPIFPLPNVVFLPGMVLPLNVFEPRYLDLVDFARTEGEDLDVADDRAAGYVGVPLLADCGKEPVDTSAPAIEPVLGVGRMVFHRLLPDGRRFIRLEGVGRAKVRRELPQEHLFRQVEVEMMPESDPRDRHSFEILKAQVERLARTFEHEDRDMVQSILTLEDPRVVIYAITALIPNVELMRAIEIEEPGQRIRCSQLTFQQSCLDAPDSDDRVELLLERSASLIAELGDSGRLPASYLN